VMYWDGGWVWMAFLPLLWIVLIGLVVWALIHFARQGAGHGDGGARWQPHRETPEEILDRRFASGEIDADAYNEARKHLAAHRPGAP